MMHLAWLCLLAIYVIVAILLFVGLLIEDIGRLKFKDVAISFGIAATWPIGFLVLLASAFGD